MEVNNNHSQKEFEEEENYEPIDLKNWKQIPCVVGRCATEKDVETGIAVFYIPNATEIGVMPVDMQLPHCAFYLDEDETVPPEPVIVIQVEKVPDESGNFEVICGVRTLDGIPAMCAEEDLAFLNGPEEFEMLD